MPFLGVEPVQEFASVAKQTITGDGSTAYTLTHSVGSPNDLAVFVNNVRQEPTTAYSASATTITFTEAIASTDSCYVMYIARTFSSASPEANSVGITELNVSDGSNGQALTTNGSGTLSFATISTATPTLAAVTGAGATTTNAVTIGNLTSTGIDDNADATAITIDSSENVGIGTASTTALRLSVVTPTANHVATQIENSNTADSFGLIVKAGNDANDYTADFRKRDNTGIMRIRGDGRVGIGTISPSYLLDVVSTTDAQFRLRTSGTGSSDDTFLRMQVGSSTADNWVYFGDADDSNAGQMGYQHSSNRFRIFTNATEALRINSDQSLQTYGGITFSGTATANNALDDYEEGTWTPYLEGYGQPSPLSQTYSSQIGLYRKVGNLIYVSYRITMTNKGNMSGNYVMLKGLPHNIGGTTYTGGYGGINYFNNLSTSVSSVWWEIGAGTTNSMWLGYRSGAGTASSYMNSSGISNTFYMTGSAVYYTS